MTEKIKKEELIKISSQQSSNLIVTAKTLEDKRNYAEAMIRGGLLPENLATIADLDDPEEKERAIGAVIAVVEFGGEMGISPWVAVQNIHNIKGKPTAGIHIFTGIAQANGIIVDVIEDFAPVLKDGSPTGNHRTTVEITRKYDKLGLVKVHKFSKTWNELALTGLTDRDNYRKRPKTMLRTRTIVEALRLYGASYYLGLYETTEIMDIVDMDYTTDEDGNVIYNAQV
jgi:hypothetical protein